MVTEFPRAALLRTYREMRGLSVEGLAEALGYTASYIWMVEAGKRSPRDIDFWMRAANILKIPTHLLGRWGGGEPPGGGDGTSLADEEEILAACWDLFYRSGVESAAPLVHASIRRIARRQERETLSPSWKSLLSRFHQLAGVLARDQDDLDAALRHGRVSLDMAEQAEVAEVHATALLRLGRTFAAQGTLAQAAMLAREGAVLAPRCPPTLRGYLQQNLADMLSREGQEPRYVIERRLGMAEEALSSPGGGEFDGSYSVLSESGIAHDWAMVLIRLRAPLEDCLGRIEQARGALPPSHLRWRTAMQCSEALAYAAHGRIGETVSLIEVALPAAKASKSHMKRLNAAYRMVATQAPDDAGVRRAGEMLRA